MKIEISFPVVVIEYREVEVSTEKAEDLVYHHDQRAEFIWSHMTEKEQEWCPNGLNGVKSAIEAGYAKIVTL